MSNMITAIPTDYSTAKASGRKLGDCVESATTGSGANGTGIAWGTDGAWGADSTWLTNNDTTWTWTQFSACLDHGFTGSTMGIVADAQRMQAMNVYDHLRGASVITDADAR